MKHLLLCVLLLTIYSVFGDDCTVSDYKKLQEAIKNCKTLNIKDLTVPANTPLLLDLKSGTKLTFAGRTTFEPAAFKGYLITIKGDNLDVLGHTGHVIDGQGAKYWHGHSTDVRPYFMSIEATNSQIKYLNLLNSPCNCVSIKKSKNLQISGFVIDNRAGDPGVAPEGYEAKNTDGFDINTSDNVRIEHSVVYNQDDCVAINDGTNYHINDLECHGSHGLSFSVAFGNKPIEASTAKNITFENCRLIGGDNGIHLKNHITAGPGLIDNVTFKNITLKDVQRVGIFIQENYPSGNPTNNVLMSNIKVSNVHGTMTGKKSTAVQIICGNGGCSDFHWSDIKITGAYNKNQCNYKPNGFSC